MSLFDKPEVNAEAFFLCKERPDRLTVYRAVFKEEALKELRSMQFRQIHRVLKRTEEVIDYNPSMNPDKHVVFKLDDKKIDEVVNLHASVVDTSALPAFSLEKNSYSAIRAVVVRYTNAAGESMFSVRKIDGRRVLQHRGKLSLVYSATAFTRFDDEVLTLDEYVDGILLEGSAYLFDRSNFEKALLFSKYIMDMAKEAVAKITKLKFLSTNGFLDELLSDQHALGKLCGIEEVGLLPKVTLKNIQDVCKKIGKSLPISDKKIELAGKADAKLLLKVLNDDYLMSELTGLRYDTHSKQKIV